MWIDPERALWITWQDNDGFYDEDFENKVFFLLHDAVAYHCRTSSNDVCNLTIASIDCGKATHVAFCVRNRTPTNRTKENQNTRVVQDFRFFFLRKSCVNHHSKAGQILLTLNWQCFFLWWKFWNIFDFFLFLIFFYSVFVTVY